MLENLTREFSPRRRYLVGVSGGRDSVALLHALSAAGYRRLIVCHLDHELRGRSAHADANFVRRLANRFDLKAEIGTTDVRALASRAKLSLETAARTARFAFFGDAARLYRCSSIFLAHHADDLVETVLFNLFRGAGMAGASAMERQSIHRIGRTKLTVIRPLLNSWRREIDAYVAAHGLKFREDATNAKLDSTRNKIRHRILPLIEEQFGRDIRSAIWRTAQIWRDENQLIESLLSAEMTTNARLRVKELRKLPVALQRRGVRKWLRAQKIADVDFAAVERVRALLEPDDGAAKVNLAGGRHARRRAGEIFLA